MEMGEGYLPLISSAAKQGKPAGMRKMVQRAITAGSGQQLNDIYEDALSSKALVGASSRTQERWSRSLPPAFWHPAWQLCIASQESRSMGVDAARMRHLCQITSEVMIVFYAHSERT